MRSWVFFMGLLLGGLAAVPGAGAADLIEVYQQVATVDPGLAQARREIQITRHQADQASAGLLPNLTGQASFRRRRTNQQNAAFPQLAGVTFINTKTFQATLEQPLYSGGRSWLNLRIADRAQSRAKAAFAAERSDLVVEVAEAYFRVLNGQKEVDLAVRERKRVRERLEQARARLEVGTGDITGVREAEARLDEAQTQLIRARNSLNNANQRLRRLLRQRPPARLAPVTEVVLESPQPDDPDRWVDRAMQNHPRLIQARQQLRIAREEIGLAKRQRYPDLSLQVQYSFQEGGFVPGQKTNTVSGSVQLTWPFYQGGSVSAQARIRQEEAAQARLQLDDRRAEIRFQAVEAYNNWHSSLSEVRSLRAQVRSSRTQMGAIETGFEVGTRTSLEVLDAQQAFFESLQNLARARHDYLLNQLKLRAAAGVLSLEDLRAINRELD